jgi:hypothetical protein
VVLGRRRATDAAVPLGRRQALPHQPAAHLLAADLEQLLQRRQGLLLPLPLPLLAHCHLGGV